MRQCLAALCFLSSTACGSADYVGTGCYTASQIRFSEPLSLDGTWTLVARTADEGSQRCSAVVRGGVLDVGECELNRNGDTARWIGEPGPPEGLVIAGRHEHVELTFTIDGSLSRESTAVFQRRELLPTYDPSNPEYASIPEENCSIYHLEEETVD